MTDKNGVEIKAGDVVRISNGFFKNDNGLWLVKYTQENMNWYEGTLGLRKITKTGKVSKASSAIGFWPIYVSVSSRELYWRAMTWNSENATIAVINDSVDDWRGVLDYFEEEAEKARKNVKMDEEMFGVDNCNTKMDRDYLRCAEMVLEWIRRREIDRAVR